ncbi:MAG: fumarylacetoacetate hydrolase family protein [Actinomycetota bacterium]
MERGWVGRIDGDRVIQLAAQTLQSLFTGGGTAREHAEYPLAGVHLLAPVLHPPAVRVFEDQTTFAFANPAAIVGPGADVTPSDKLSPGRLVLVPRLAGVIGVDGALAGFTAFADWRDPTRMPPKDRDFALGLGPVVATPDDLDADGLEGIVRVDGSERTRVMFAGFDWDAARDLAEAGTRLIPGDLIAGPPALAEAIPRGSVVELELEGIGVLEQLVAGG